MDRIGCVFIVYIETKERDSTPLVFYSLNIGYMYSILKNKSNYIYTCFMVVYCLNILEKYLFYMYSIFMG